MVSCKILSSRPHKAQFPSLERRHREENPMLYWMQCPGNPEWNLFNVSVTHTLLSEIDVFTSF